MVQQISKSGSSWQGHSEDMRMPALVGRESEADPVGGENLCNLAVCDGVCDDKWRGWGGRLVDTQKRDRPHAAIYY